MSSGFAISALIPSIVSSSIFSSRRANSGIDAIADTNPFVGVMNMDIASGQVFNAAKSASEIAKTSKNSMAKAFTSAEEAIKNISNSDRFLKGFGKVVSFTANNINPIICATGTVKVLASDNKQDAAIQEGTALGAMFMSEAAAKRILGLPNFKSLGGKKVAIPRKGLYKNISIINDNVDKLKTFCNNTKICGKSIGFVPSIIKGLTFVAASIGGYKLGTEVGINVIETGKTI